MNKVLDLDCLRAFVAVADIGNFTRAGEALHRTQSAISMQIKRLEQQLEKPLFHRAARQSALTHDGELLLGYARRLLKLNDEALNQLAQPTLSGTVRLGTPDDYAMHLLPEVLAQFAQSYPQVSVEVCCEDSPTLSGMLANGKLDIGLLTNQPGLPRGEPLRREQLYWVGAPQGLLFEESRLPLALSSDDCVLRKMALAELERAGREWRLAYSSPSGAAMNAAVAAGLAITVLVGSSLEPGLKALGEDSGLPALPSVELALHRAAGGVSRPAARLAEHMHERLGNVESAAA